jgi:hypothetical protein
MNKRTLQFKNLFEVAHFSKQVSSGYLMNTNKFTLTGKFSDAEVELALRKFNARVIETTELVYAYQ